MNGFRRTVTFGSPSVHLLIFILLLSRGRGTGQTQKSATDLIQELVHLPDAVGGTCGQLGTAIEEKRAVAQSLVSLGASAIPDIESALDSVEKGGDGSEFANSFDWLLIDYAKLKGPAAFLRIRRMRGDPRLSDKLALDTAAALSLGLTSYVRVVDFFRLINVDALRDMRRSPEIPPCSSAFFPQNALDILILAWEKGDRAMIEESLGPNARGVLDSLTKNRTWDRVRAELWQVKLSDKTAVGYRFDVRGPGTEPFAFPKDAKPGGANHPDNPEIETFFKDGGGNECGRRRIQFLSPSFKIDNSDIVELLRQISACAASE